MSASKSQRGKGFLIDEDKTLCEVYLEVTQDPIIGVNQKKDKLWERISVLFHSRRPSFCNENRTPRSLSCRFSAITKATNKFRGCYRQIENLNPSGASEMDIVSIKLLFYYTYSNVLFFILLLFFFYR